MTKPIRKLLGELLVEDGLITKAQLDECLLIQRTAPGRKLGDILIELGYLQEEGLALSVSKKTGTKFIMWADDSFVIRYDQKLDQLVDEKFAADNVIVPLSKTEHEIAVAMWDPFDLMLIDNIKRMSGLEPVVHCATKHDILEGINALYFHIYAQHGERGDIGRRRGEPEAPERTVRELNDLKLKAAEAPVVKIVNSCVADAVRQGASDIHIEQHEEKVSIRFRVDGVLYETNPPDLRMVPAVISRIKILSKIDIAERRLPQDGGFMMTIEKRRIDFRVSTIPTIYGEKVVMRVLDKGKIDFDLSSIGLSKTDHEKVVEHITRPHGLVILTGPTGSGKTTMLYAILKKINSRGKNIITVEDPVEYRIDGVNQVQVQSSIGLDFARALRAFLRQDPDIIMVGEIRDLETAEICIRSALVGRLVLSTLHTNDSVTSVVRLLDFGLEPFLVSSTISMVIAQRLVRRLCNKCKKPVKLDPATAVKYGLRDATVYGPGGCPECFNRGFSGRCAIFEIFVVDDEIKDMIEKRSPIDAIRNAAIKKGLKTLRQDALDKVREGIVSLDEVLIVTMDIA